MRGFAEVTGPRTSQPINVAAERQLLIGCVGCCRSLCELVSVSHMGAACLFPDRGSVA